MYVDTVRNFITYMFVCDDSVVRDVSEAPCSRAEFETRPHENISCDTFYSSHFLCHMKCTVCMRPFATIFYDAENVPKSGVSVLEQMNVPSVRAGHKM